LLVVDKPPGVTSHDVVMRVRRIAGQRKVGHAGTLDPMATGVLVAGLGRATRLLGHLGAADKTYRATIRLGQSSDTDDATGGLSELADVSTLSETSLRTAMRDLTGDLLQVPSAMSAVKVSGRRAYVRVRAGEEVSLPPRAVTVRRFDLEAVREHDRVVDLDVLVECSTGTYVRALARDLGSALDVGGHLAALRRTRAGPFTEDEAHSLESLAALAAEDLPVLSMSDVAARAFPTYRVDGDVVPAVRYGRRLSLDLTGAASQGPVAILTGAGEFLALYETAGVEARPLAVFAPAH
jgi:tRNA pseudouridine55 synthase